MQLKHASTTASASFDDPNLVSSAGLVPIMALAEKAGLRRLAQKWLSVPTDKGANVGLKVASLVGGMVAGAGSIDLCRYWDYADRPQKALAEALVSSCFRR